MNTIGDALNPVYINDRGVPKKISEGAGALKDKLAIGMDANGALKATDLATGGAGYDDTKIATKGYVDSKIPSVPTNGRLLELVDGKFHVKVDDSLKNTDGSVKSTDFVGIGANGQLVAAVECSFGANSWYMKYSNGLVDMGGKVQFDPLEEDGSGNSKIVVEDGVTRYDVHYDLIMNITFPVTLSTVNGSNMIVTANSTDGVADSPYPGEWVCSVRTTEHAEISYDHSAATFNFLNSAVSELANGHSVTKTLEDIRKEVGIKMYQAKLNGLMPYVYWRCFGRWKNI